MGRTLASAPHLLYYRTYPRRWRRPRRKRVASPPRANRPARGRAANGHAPRAARKRRVAAVGVAVSVDAVQRCQLAYVSPADIAAVTGADPAQATWPTAQAADLGAAPAERGRPASCPTGPELGAALLSAYLREGIHRLRARLHTTEHGAPGTERAQRLHMLGSATLAWLHAQGWTLAPVASESE